MSDKDKNIDVTDNDLEQFHETLGKIIDYYKEHESQAFSIIGSLQQVSYEIPWNVEDLVSE